MLWLTKVKFDPNLFRFMLRLLNLLLCEWKMCQLEAKIETKKISYIFKSEAYDYLNQVLAGTNKKVGKCYLWGLNFRTKIRILQSVNLLHYNCLTSVFFKSNVTRFEGSNCFLRFILDQSLVLIFNKTILNILGNFIFHEMIVCDDKDQKQPSRGVFIKKCFENM